MHPFMVMVAAQLAFAGGQADKEMKTACLMQQKASLDQPLHFSDEADAGAHAEYLRSALVMVKELASNVTTWDTGLSKNERDSLDLIKTFIEDLQKSAANSHDEDQREVMRAKELIADCAKTTRTSIAVNVDPLKTTMEGSREDHDACRTREADCQKKEDDHCQKWESYRKSNVPHECADVDFKNDMKTEVAETKADMEQCLRDLQPFYLKHIPCRQYLECKHGFAPLCDTNQTNFERDFCAYSRELSGTCEAQTNCRRKHIDFRDATHADVATNEKARKADYTTSKKVICYFAVFEGNITNKSAILQGCDKLTVDTTQLDIAYPEIPDAERCDVEKSQPCDDDWVSAEYDTKDWKRYVTMLDCVACPAPAPAPTNPPKVPPAVGPEVTWNTNGWSEAQISNGGRDINVGPHGGWKNSNFANEDITARGPQNGVKFKCNCRHIANAITDNAPTGTSSWNMDWVFKCRPSCKADIYEMGRVMKNDIAYKSLSSVIEMRVGKDNYVEYLVDGQVVFNSRTHNHPVDPNKKYHYAISWHDGGAQMRDIEYIGV